MPSLANAGGVPSVPGIPIAPGVPSAPSIPAWLVAPKLTTGNLVPAAESGFGVQAEAPPAGSAAGSSARLVTPVHNHDPIIRCSQSLRVIQTLPVGKSLELAGMVNQVKVFNLGRLTESSNPASDAPKVVVWSAAAPSMEFFK